MFDPDVISQITSAAHDLGIEPAAMLAVADVESGGVAFAAVNGRREPLIRFEAHYFDRRLTDSNRAVARRNGLAAPVAGAIPNPATQVARWNMLDRAAAIDRKAAYESVSWGLGQVMGAHWLWLGYQNVEALVAEVRSSVAGQVRLMVLYIDKAGLAKALTDHDWTAFARGYNGPAYARNGYHRRLANAYAIYAGTSPDQAIAQGSRGAVVRQLQRDLDALGYGLRIDGIFGPATVAAVKRFQADNELAVDGIAGQQTMVRLKSLTGSSTSLTQTGSYRLWAWLKGWLARILPLS